MTDIHLEARSSIFLTQADRLALAFAAAREYRSFLSSLMRIVRYSRSPFSTVGLPLGRLSMCELCTNRYSLTTSICCWYIKGMKTLTEIQEQALQKMQEPRTSELRARKMRHRVLRQYRKEALSLGYTAEQVEMQVVDLRDMYRLRTDAMEEHRGWL